jgi:DNA mismatch repair protein MutS2
VNYSAHFSDAADALEFTAVRERLAREAQSVLGRERALALEPAADRDTVARRLATTTETRRFFAEIAVISIGEVPDPRPVLAQLRIGGTHLSPEDLRLLMKLMETGGYARGIVRPHRDGFPLLASVTDRLPDLSGLLRKVQRIVLPSGEINEDASPELRRLRSEIQIQRGRLQRQLESLLRRTDLDGVFSDDIITQRNGRFVVPVRNDNRGKLPGVVHAMSSSGMTAFVEPMASIEFNNEMVRLQEAEEAEIARLLFEVSEQLRAHYDDLVRLGDALGELDFVAARARFANRYDAVAPVLSTEGVFSVTQARHPLLDAQLRENGKSAVPVDFALSDTERTLVISGANAGGKTVVLKTAGLFILMAQSGLHVPARAAELPLFAQVHADIGDHQSLAANLSTFSSHVTHLTEISDVLDTPALVLLDEVGTGTDPDEGAALAVAIVEHFRKAGAYVMASTHFNPLKIYADTSSGVINASVEFDAATLQPTYRLLCGESGNSSGIEIARRLGLPESIVQDATGRLGEREAAMTRYLATLQERIDYQRDSMAALEDERAAFAKRFGELEREFHERELARRAVFEEELAGVRDDLLSRVQPVLDRIGNQVERTRAQREVVKAVDRGAALVGKKFQPPPPETRPDKTVAKGGVSDQPKTVAVTSADDLKVGDSVLTGFGQPGIVDAVEGDTVAVRVGSLRLKAGLTSLKKIIGSESRGKLESARSKAKTATSALMYDIDVPSDAPRELKLIGLTTDEAVTLADKFLDQAVLSGFQDVRIVHGMGTGALRRAIDEFLSSHPHVERFARAPRGEGGDGATIVELRD